jgi:anti-sigma factor RsiW
MNSCSDSVNILRYLDNALSGQELETFGAHLQNCPTCKVRVEEGRALSRVCTGLVPCTGHPKRFEAKCRRSLSSTLRPEAKREFTSDR